VGPDGGGGDDSAKRVWLGEAAVPDPKTHPGQKAGVRGRSRIEAPCALAEGCSSISDSGRRR
jgi:hypothetical protein